MDEEIKQNSFEGYAIVELMGHRREIGYVTTEHYGGASLFRVDSPAFEEREFTLERPGYVDGRMVPAGSKVKRQAIPAKSCLVGPGSIYALNPCTEETARQAIERSVDRPLILLHVPDRPQIASVSRETAVDPVCGAEVEVRGVVCRFEEKNYYFCSDACREEFKATPEDYVGETDVQRFI